MRAIIWKEAPDGVATEMLDEGLVREDLTALDFVTIDSASTEDMDDALFAKALPDDKLQLIVAIADPTAWDCRRQQAGQSRENSRIHQLSARLQHPYAASRAF